MFVDLLKLYFVYREEVFIDVFVDLMKKNVVMKYSII